MKKFDGVGAVAPAPVRQIRWHLQCSRFVKTSDLFYVLGMMSLVPGLFFILWPRGMTRAQGEQYERDRKNIILLGWVYFGGGCAIILVRRFYFE
jgi:uncharacterized membrane protein